MMSKLLHKDKSEKVLGVAFEVRNEMKAGWSEKQYHQAFVDNLRSHSIPTLSKPQSALIHRDAIVHIFIPDLLVWDLIILELKVLPFYSGRNFPSQNVGQTIHYLKRFGKDLGILLNFAHAKVGIKRVAYEPEPLQIVENYDRIRGTLSQRDRQLLIEVRYHIIQLANHYGIGYKEELYRKLLAVEFDYQGMDCICNVNVPVQWRGNDLGAKDTQHILVANRILILVRAVKDGVPTYDYIRTMSYLDTLGLPFGLIVNFADHMLRINTVSNKPYPRPLQSALELAKGGEPE